jgi:hypothetical protein
MGDDDEIHTTYYTSHFDMDEAFCTRMRAAIEAGLESAPIGVVTTYLGVWVLGRFQESLGRQLHHRAIRTFS